MRPIDADALKETKYVYHDNGEVGERLYISFDEIDNAPTVDAVSVKQVITALMDLRDAFVAKQPRGEWVNNKTAQGVEKGIEMCIEKVRELSAGTGSV